jgi:hypothetical protein
MRHLSEGEDCAIAGADSPAAAAAVPALFSSVRRVTGGMLAFSYNEAALHAIHYVRPGYAPVVRTLTGG